MLVIIGLCFTVIWVHDRQDKKLVKATQIIEKLQSVIEQLEQEIATTTINQRRQREGLPNLPEIQLLPESQLSYDEAIGLHLEPVETDEQRQAAIKREIEEFNQHHPPESPQ